MKAEGDTFLAAIKDFLTVYLPKQRCFSANTVKSYKATLRLFAEFMESERKTGLLQLSALSMDRETVTAFLSWLKEVRKNSSATCNQRLMALRAFARYLGLNDIEYCTIHADLSAIAVMKTSVKPVEFLSETALETLLRQPDTGKAKGLRDSFFMIFLYDTAARCQEALDVCIGDLVLNERAPYTYLTGKGNKTRTVPLMKRTVEHLNRYLSHFHGAEQRSDDLLFYTTLHGKRCPMSPDTAAHFMKRYGESARKECAEVPERIHPHQLRHTRSIHLYRQGMPLALLSEFLGHADISSSQVYAYADTEMKREAIEKACPGSTCQIEQQFWSDDEETLRRLYGLA
jgi:site-specific recombinase XerD